VSTRSHENLTQQATGALLIHALGDHLPKPEKALAWQLIDRWTRELIELRHHRPEAAA
jgi:hypothetical protein